jgi:hypothetical protein
MHSALRQPNLDAASRPSLCAGRKIGVVELALLWSLLHEEPDCTSRELFDKVAQSQASLSLSVRQLNRWRVKWQLNRRRGRPPRRTVTPNAGPDAVVQVRPRLSFVGVHLLAHWLDQHGTLDPVVAQLQQAITAHQYSHPDEDFALLHHREATLRRRFQALLLAPLFGIERLTAFDTQEHPLPTLLGRGYHSSTLSQFLGQLERVGAAEALRPVLGPAQPGSLAYVDGHMIAYWSRMPMHKGKITMLGRMMAGSQAVIAHNDAGYALFVTYYPPDLSLSAVIVAYCQQVVQATGSHLFVIDRAVNSVAMARAFEEHGMGLMCMLDDNEHHGLESFDATQVGTLDDGTPLYSGTWQEPRPGDPRPFVIVEPPEGKTLVYWGTSKVKASLEVSRWPAIYRARNELQEQSFKRMNDHGALKTNYGRKTISGPDRHWQRAKAKLEQGLGSAQRRVEQKTEEVQGQQLKVAESEIKGHGKRLVQRQEKLAVLETEYQALAHKRDQLCEQAAALEPMGERADRDFRKQTIMTIRTLFLENALLSFLSVLVGHMQVALSLECLLSLLFERSGARVETGTQVIYWVNTTGLSVRYRRTVTMVAQGLCAMGLTDQGKPVQVRLKDMPP